MKKLIFAAAIVFFAAGTRAHAGVRCHEFMGTVSCVGTGDDFGYQSRTHQFMGTTTTNETYFNPNGGMQQRTTRCHSFMGTTSCN